MDVVISGDSFPGRRVSRRSLHRLDVRLDELDLGGVKTVLCVELRVYLRDRSRPVDVGARREVLGGDVLPDMALVVLGYLPDPQHGASKLGADVLAAGVSFVLILECSDCDERSR